ncbi:MAG TPA: 3-carboxy-cis,cis-muconate cycloisomerase [Gaiellales bacterium]
MFDALFVPDGARAALGDRAWVQAMLDAERALAAAGAEAGVVPASAASAIAEVCSADLFDAVEIAIAARLVGNPAEPLVRALRERVGGEPAAYVHHGATSQDIVDTAAMLVARRVLDLLLVDVDAVADACATLTRTYRDTPMVARTLMQQALPTTFGLKTAGWLVGLVESRRLLVGARARLAVQLGGAAGTLASLGDAGPQVLAAMARELDLVEPTIPWHTTRVRVAELAAALVAVSGALAKIALDIVLLAQTEVGELAERSGDGRGASSTLPHKRNPVGSTLTIACARRVEVFAGLLAGGPPHEHERAAGTWHAEWEGLEGVLGSTAGAASALRGVLEGLEVDERRMRENLELTRGLIMAERVQQLIADGVGRMAAREIVSAAAARTSERRTLFADELRADDRMPLGPDELADALDPVTYLGSAGVFADRALDVWSKAQLEL